MAQIDLADYLFRRLYQLGIRAIHGVPGDYNLTALDYVEPAGLDWVGNCNELNAGYAADGYARVKGISGVVTAFGVGELSAINAIAGAYAEKAPVVHIIGTPPTTLQESGACMHHSLGDGNFRFCAEMYAKVTVAQANLVEAATAPEDIDNALRECLIQSRPVYIELPTNMVTAKVSSTRLDQEINTSLPHDDEGFEEEEVDLILSRLYAAQQPFIIVDGFARAYNILDECNELVKRAGIPTSTTPFGKSIVDETLPNFHGVYAGSAGLQDYVPWAKSCDLVLRIAPLNSDVNTYGFSTIPNPAVTITFDRDAVRFGPAHTDGTSSDSSTHYRTLSIKSLLNALLTKLDESKLYKPDPYPSHLGNPRAELALLPKTGDHDHIDQHTFYRRISPFFNRGDIILTETGTPSVGGRDLILPPHTILINSSIWLSIGYMLGAAQGAAIAHKELVSSSASDVHSGRTILIMGDGSFQVTAQELSTIIRKRLDMTILLINNDGYTIERWIHGMKETYNDIASWRYLDAASFFGADLDDQSYPITSIKATNWGEMNRALQSEAFTKGKGLTMVEVCMGREDAPESLKKLVAGAAKRNASVASEMEPAVEAAA